MMLRPLWEKPCEALLPGRPVIMAPCARELLSDVPSPLLHRMNQTTINLNE